MSFTLAAPLTEGEPLSHSSAREYSPLGAGGVGWRVISNLSKNMSINFFSVEKLDKHIQISDEQSNRITQRCFLFQRT